MAKKSRGTMRFLRYAVLVAAWCCLAVPAAVAQTPEEDLARFPGVAEPSHRVVIRAEIDGRLMGEAMPKEGQAFRKGEVVARLDDQEQQAAVALAELTAESGLAVLRAASVVEELKLRLAQAEEMFQKAAGTEYEVRQQKVQLDLAVVDLRLAEEERRIAAIRLEAERARLERMRVRAPFAGVVTRVEARDGGTVTQGDPIALLVSLDPLRVELPLPLFIYGRLEAGQRYRLKGSDPIDGELAGTLVYVDPMLDTASRTFRAVFEIANPDQQMPSGFVVTLVDAEPVPVPAPATQPDTHNAPATQPGLAAAGHEDAMGVETTPATREAGDE